MQAVGVPDASDGRAAPQLLAVYILDLLLFVCRLSAFLTLSTGMPHHSLMSFAAAIVGSYRLIGASQLSRQPCTLLCDAVPFFS